MSPGCPAPRGFCLWLSVMQCSAHHHPVQLDTSSGRSQSSQVCHRHQRLQGTADSDCADSKKYLPVTLADAALSKYVALSIREGREGPHAVPGDCKDKDKGRPWAEEALTVTPADFTTSGETTRPTSKKEAAHATMPKATCFPPHGTCSNCGLGVPISVDLAGSNMGTSTNGRGTGCSIPNMKQATATPTGQWTLPGLLGAAYCMDCLEAEGLEKDNHMCAICNVSSGMQSRACLPWCSVSVPLEEAPCVLLLWGRRRPLL